MGGGNGPGLHIGIASPLQSGKEKRRQPQPTQVIRSDFVVHDGCTVSYSGSKEQVAAGVIAFSDLLIRTWTCLI